METPWAPPERAAEMPSPSVPTWGVTVGRYLLLSVFWLPISLFWGMMLPQILPTRVEDLAGEFNKGKYLSAVAVPGAAAAAIVQLVIGPISDHCRARWGRRRPFLLVGTLGAIVTMLLFAKAQSLAGLIASFFGIQLLLNVANGPFQAVIPDHVPPTHQGRASVWMGLMQLLGEAGGPVLAGLMLGGAAKFAAAHGLAPAAAHALKDQAVWRLLVLDAGLLLVCLIILLIFVPDGPSDDPRAPSVALRQIAEVRPREHPDFFRLLISRGVFNLGFYIALDFLLFYVRDSLKQGANASGVLLKLQLCAIGGALIGTFPSGWLADRISKRRIIYVSGALSALAGLAFALTSGVNSALVMAISFGLGLGIFRAVDWAFACNLLPTGGAARYMALWSLSATLPQVIAPGFGPLADVLNQRLGMGMGWRAAMLATVVSVLAGTALVRGVRERSLAAEEQTEPR